MGAIRAGDAVLEDDTSSETTLPIPSARLSFDDPESPVSTERLLSDEDSFESDTQLLDEGHPFPTHACNVYHLGVLKNWNPYLYGRVASYFAQLKDQSLHLRVSLEALSDTMTMTERVQPAVELLLVGLRVGQRWGPALKPGWANVVQFVTGSQLVGQRGGGERIVTVWHMPPAAPKAPSIYGKQDIAAAIHRAMHQRAAAARMRAARREQRRCLLKAQLSDLKQPGRQGLLSL